jgi:hypothetical protein
MVEPDRPPGHRSLSDFGMRRVAEKRPPPEVDQAEVERDVEAKRQARKQRKQDATAAAAAAKWSVGWPKGKPGPAVPTGGVGRGAGQHGRLDAARQAEMMRWDDGWDADASKPFGKPWKLVLAPSKSFEKTLEPRDLAGKSFEVEVLLESYGTSLQ